MSKHQRHFYRDRYPKLCLQPDLLRPLFVVLKWNTPFRIMSVLSKQAMFLLICTLCAYLRKHLIGVERNTITNASWTLSLALILTNQSDVHGLSIICVYFVYLALYAYTWHFYGQSISLVPDCIPCLIYIYIYVYIHMCVCIYIYVYLSLSISLSLSLSLYTHKYIYKYV